MSTNPDPTVYRYADGSYFAAWLAELDKALRTGDVRRERRARLFVRRGLTSK